MRSVYVLTTESDPNSRAFNLPLYVHCKMLRDFGVDIFFREAIDLLEDCDVLFVNSKIFKNWWSDRKDDIFILLAAFKQRANVVLWFDTDDSTGTTQFSVLPFVDGYYKNQILKDKQLYLNSYYGHRLYTDYYHENFDVCDDDRAYGECILVQNELEKVHSSWNSALGDYGLLGSYLEKVRKSIPVPKRYYILPLRPKHDRRVDISCRFARSYSRNTIRFQRECIAEMVYKQYQISTDRIPRWSYINELRNSKIGVSPFGWGEIAYRDFELFLYGVALFKPDVSHMETWPPLYVDGETYVSHDWDFSNVLEKIDKLLSHNRYREIATNGYERYQKYLFELEGREAFCRLVAQIVERHT